MDGITKPGPVNLRSGNVHAKWLNFKQKFEIFLIATQKTGATKKVKWAMLMGEAGEDALQIYNGFKSKLVTSVTGENGAVTVTDNSQDYEAVIAMFDEYTKENKSITNCRELFNKRSQKKGEPFSNFLTAAQNLVKDCEYGALEDEMLRDRLIWGVADTKLAQGLRGKAKLTLEETINLCKAAELAANEATDNEPQVDELMHSRRSSSQSTRKPFKANKPNRAFNQRKPWGQNKPHGQLKSTGHANRHGNRKFLCSKCGKWHLARQCPAFGHTCENCGRSNHFGRCCTRGREPTSNKPGPVQKRSVDGVEELDNVILKDWAKVDELAIDKLTEKNVHMVSLEEDDEVLPQKRLRKEYSEVLRLQGKHYVQFKLDCGSEVNILPLRVFDKLNKEGKYTMSKSNVVLRAFGATKSTVEGEIHLLTETKFGKSCVLTYLITRADNRPLLGIEACEILNLVKRVEQTTEASVNTIAKQLPESVTDFVNQNIEVFTGLGTFAKPIKILVDHRAPPGMCPPRRLNHSVAVRLKAKLDALEDQGVVAKITDEMPKYISNLVIREKSNGELRLCLDPANLNKAIITQKYPIPTIEEISCKVKDKRVFTVLDMKDGFWQAALDYESSLLCAFSTPYGLYRFLRMPFGLSCAPEIFQFHTDELFSKTGAIPYFDDILVPGEDENEHDKILNNVLKVGYDQNIKFNKEKVQYRQTQVKFLGLLWSHNEIKIDPERVKAIWALKEPTTRKQLQRVCAVFNHLRKFIPQMGTISAPLCEMLSTKVKFQWLPIHSEAFSKLKECVCNAPSLVPYDSRKGLIVQADASQTGLGAVLLQNNALVSSASRKLTDTEQNYAQIEKEMLALSFAAEKFEHFIYGVTELKFQTDHQPLVSVFKKPLAKITNGRLKKLRLKMLKFQPQVEYLPGKYMYLADLLSRDYLQDHVDDDPEMVEVVHEVTSNLAISSSIKGDLREETARDVGLTAVKGYYQNGWPASNKKVICEAQPYWKIRNEIFIEDDLVILEDRVIVPPALRAKVLQTLHAAHQGIEKTKSRARQVVYWPGLANDIQTLVAECRVCERYSSANKKEPLVPHEVPTLRFQRVCADIAEFQSDPYLIVVDAMSKWLEIKKLQSKSSSSVIEALRLVFSTHGIPETIYGDNNPLNSFECRQFAESIGSKIVTSSPEYPRSNGLAEKGVHIAKQILKKCSDEKTSYLDALREYNNTPLAGMTVSPAQILMSRMCRTLVPTLSRNLEPKVVDVRPQLMVNQSRVKQAHDRKARRKPIEFSAGEKIVYWKGKKWRKGVIVKRHSAPRSYIIRQPSGREIRRNTYHLRRSHANPDCHDNWVEPYDFNNDNFLPQEQRPAPHRMERRQQPNQARAQPSSENFEDVPLPHSQPCFRRRRQNVEQAVVLGPRVEAGAGMRASRTRSGREVRLPSRFRE